MVRRKEWKKKSISRGLFNRQLYEVLDETLINYRTTPQSDRYNDARLIPREILDNLYRHNSALNIILTTIINDNDILTVEIYHDGEEFNPFDPNKKCPLLWEREQEYKFASTFMRTERGNLKLTLKFDLSDINKGTIQ